MSEDSTSVATIVGTIAEAVCRGLSCSLTQQQLSQSSPSNLVSNETPEPARCWYCSMPVPASIHRQFIEKINLCSWSCACGGVQFGEKVRNANDVYSKRLQKHVS